MKKIIETTKKENIYYCDICGDVVIYGCDLKYDDEDNFDYGSDGKYEKTYHYDICEECIEKVLFPYIKRKTKKEPRVEEIDY